MVLKILKKMKKEVMSKKFSGNYIEIMAMMGVGSMGNPLHNKMNEEHITQVLDLATKHDEREYNVHMSNQDKGDKQTFPLN